MDRSEFASHLRKAVIGALCELAQSRPDERPYALAIILGQCGNYLGCAIATEQGLQHTATRYEAMGYRYRGNPWEQFDNRQELAVWLRWAHPDDGWYYQDFAERFQVAKHLRAYVEAGAFGEDAKELEDFCTDAMLTLRSEAAWSAVPAAQELTVGVIAGEVQHEFLRTATRCNPHAHVRKLWEEYWEAKRLAKQISRLTDPSNKRTGAQPSPPV